MIIKQKKPYVLVNKNVVTHPCLSFGAIGLFTYLMYHTDDIQTENYNDTESISLYIKELEKYGYAEVDWQGNYTVKGYQI